MLTGLSITLPTINISSTTMGIFIINNYVGFSFNTSGGIYVHCSYKINESKCHCQFGASFVTMLLNDAKWLVSKAAWLGDETEEALMTLGTDIANFEADAASQISSAATKLASIASNLASKGLSAIKSGVSSLENSATSTWSTVSTGATKVTNTIGKALSSIFG